MAIELSFVPEGTRTVVPIDTLAPGEMTSFEDHSVGDPVLLTIGCDPDNGGGAVYGLDPQGDNLDLGSFGRMVNVTDLTEANRLRHLPLDGDDELPIRLASGLRGMLVLEHTSEY